MKGQGALLAEFIGTFFMCFAGIATILGATGAVGSGTGLVGIALAQGLAVSVAVNAFGGVSGAHFNPAVTVSMLVTGRIAAPTAAAYVVSQLAGSTAAAAACRLIFPTAAVAEANLGIPLPAGWVTPGVVIGMELILTFLLVAAIYGTALDPRGEVVNIGGFGIGLVVTFAILAGGPVSGASMNPARSFGPALVQGYWHWHVLYWIAPIVGAVSAALLYERVIMEEPMNSGIRGIPGS